MHGWYVDNFFDSLEFESNAKNFERILTQKKKRNVKYLLADEICDLCHMAASLWAWLSWLALMFVNSSNLCTVTSMHKHNRQVHIQNNNPSKNTRMLIFQQEITTQTNQTNVAATARALSHQKNQTKRNDTEINERRMQNSKRKITSTLDRIYNKKKRELFLLLSFVVSCMDTNDR